MTTQTLHAAPSDTLMEDLRLVIADAEALLSATTDKASEGATSARARIQQRLEAVKQNLCHAERALLERAQQAAKGADQYVHDHPWQAIGICAGLGAIVGMLIARR